MSKKNALPDKPENHLVVFQEKAIRRIWHNKEWFAIVDVVTVLTDSVQPEGYVKDLRRRDKELAKGWGQIATPFALKPKAVCSGLIAPIPRASSASSSPSHRPRRNLSSAGWRRWVTSGRRKSKIRNWPAPVPASCTRLIPFPF